MKKIIYFSFFLIIINIYSYSQVYTPKGTNISSAYEVFDEWSSEEKASLAESTAEQFPNAVLVGQPTKKYNCHAYAWYIVDGGSNVWMNQPISAYWQDGSFVETSNLNDASKVSYGISGDYDHSAVMTNESDIFISKWGAIGLMKHHKAYCPYNSSNIKYYKNDYLEILGPTNVCAMNNYIYTVKNLPSGATCYWSIEGNIPLGTSINSSSGLLEVANISVNNVITIKTLITYSGKTYVSRKKVNLNTFVLTGTYSVLGSNYDLMTSNSLPSGNYNSFNICVNSPVFETYNWSVQGNSVSTNGSSSKCVTVYFGGSSRAVTVTLTGRTSACGQVTKIFGFYGNSYYSIYPTPSSNLIYIESITENSLNLKYNISNSKTCELYDLNKSNLIKKVDLLNNNSQTQLDVSDVSAGYYILVIKEGGKIVFQNKVLIQK